MTGCGHSTPMIDQVPELKQAQFPPLAGTAATAAPVSCEHDAMTSICGPSSVALRRGDRPVSMARVFFNGPGRVPDGQMGANKSSRNSSASSNFFDHVLVCGL